MSIKWQCTYGEECSRKASSIFWLDLQACDAYELQQLIVNTSECDPLLCRLQCIQENEYLHQRNFTHLEPGLCKRVRCRANKREYTCKGILSSMYEKIYRFTCRHSPANTRSILSKHACEILDWINQHSINWWMLIRKNTHLNRAHNRVVLHKRIEFENRYGSCTLNTIAWFTMINTEKLKRVQSKCLPRPRAQSAFAQLHGRPWCRGCQPCWNKGKHTRERHQGVRFEYERVLSALGLRSVPGGS